MNLLCNIFLENFQYRYYYGDTGRAYVEYICEQWNWFSGKICFFHFSHSKIQLNWFHDVEIMKFIKLFYSNAFVQIYPLMKYAIEHNIVMTMNSIDEYEFVIKFWNENLAIRRLIEYTIKKYTWFDYTIENTENTRFIEINISTKRQFILKNIKIYSEIYSHDALVYQDGYIDHDNISMLLDIQIVEFNNSVDTSKWLLIKLIDPIRFSDSEYLMRYYLPHLDTLFMKDNIYCSFIEQRDWGDLIYFTDGYSVRA